MLQRFFSGLDDDWVAVAAAACVLSATILVVSLVQGARERRRRLDLLDAMLRRPDLTPDVQRDIVRALQPPRRRLPFVAGWFGLFAGIVWLSSDPHGRELTAAWTFTVGAFALLTLPFALRELETRGA